MSANKIPKEFLGEISEENQRWFDLYQDKNYRSQIKRFLRYKEHNNKPFHLMTIDDIRKFADMLDNLENPYKSNGFNNFIYGIAALAKTLREKQGKPFGKDFLVDITAPLVKPTKDTESPGEVLTLEQIRGIRKYNKEQKTIYEEYIFELLFQLGITIEDINYCKPKYQNNKENIFDIDGRKKFPYNKKIATLLEKLTPESREELDNKDFNNNYVSAYLQKATAFLEREIKYKGKDISKNHMTKSHNAYILSCPNCERKIENIAKNWILVRAEIDDEYRLVCAECKGR